ncbi:hypothetical protein [Anabaena sp. UHCC 0451]|uniref:hypothetical protein n=1 Tax=Anabaena sp. UHCC 0451 TaxID=2055235 RepID=UPI002B20BFFE|nr:hypothetical protein [Anabaena sp. UHCC 0451]MEA5578459.1 hypothetical protein [Anabaena sp. UHCC 0451]
MILILPFVISAVGFAVGAVAGAFTSHAVGENDRQAAKHHRKIANELVEKLYYLSSFKKEKQLIAILRILKSFISLNMQKEMKKVGELFP